MEEMRHLDQLKHQYNEQLRNKTAIMDKHSPQSPEVCMHAYVCVHLYDATSELLSTHSLFTST